MNDLLDQPKELATVEPGGGMTPLDLLQRAIDRGLDPEQLKALVDLQERWNANRAKEEFSAAMNACQEELPQVVKDAENNQTKSRYARMENIQAIAKPVLTKHGFSLSFGEADGAGPEMKRTICDVRHRAGHCEQYHLDLPLDGVGAKGNAIGSMNRVQAAVSTGSYAQRYLTCRIFNITIADADVDGRLPAHPRPAADPNAPRAAPRNQRQDTPPEQRTGVAIGHLREIERTWKEQFPEDAEDNTAFATWVKKASGRDFNTRSPGAWTKEDVDKCCRALQIPTDEDLGIPH